MKPCPFCREPIQDEAIKCKHCGELLSAELRKAAATKYSPLVAFLASLIFPGAGLIYVGLPFSALAAIIVFAFSLIFFPIGPIVILILSGMSAANQAIKKSNRDVLA